MKNISIRYLKGVGPRKEAVFNDKAGIHTLRDLLYYFPFRYEDRTNFKNISDLAAGEYTAAKGEIVARNLRKLPYFRRSSKIRSIFEIIIRDKSAKISCKWFNQPYLYDLLKVGQKLIIYGKPSLYQGRLQMVAPKFESSGSGTSLNLGRITAIYRLPPSLSQRYIRKIISAVLYNYRSRILDPIPYNIRRKEKIPNIAKSFQQIHFPSSWEDADTARQRFIFEELFISQIMVYMRKAAHRLQKGPPLGVREEIVTRIKQALPFELTFSQKKALAGILSDLEKSYPMHRLLQADVGSGKTVLAFFPLILTALASWQAAFMVPTEVLAHQHKQVLDRIIREGGYPLGTLKNKVEIITSSLSVKEKKAAAGRLAESDSRIVFGTHSLIQENLKFKKLGLVVIDEQHKFGVGQRMLLPKKGQVPPNCLVMSATPIPRSLALSLYGDLDLSVINRPPPNRGPVKTVLVGEKQRKWVYSFMEKKINENKQVYIVYPVIDPVAGMRVRSLNQMQAKIKKRFSRYSTEIFHGRMKARKKNEIIDKFRQGRIDILISTNVIEVGLDIVKATTMVVESPERFGLSQLHQLRGRIRRSADEATFILICPRGISPEAKERLAVIEKENSGFKIAEEDLKLRGPGDFFGRLQHGLPDLKVADPRRDLEVLRQARKYARELIGGDPCLKKVSSKSLRNYFGKYFSLGQPRNA